LPVGAKDEIDPVFGGAAPAAELLCVAAGSDLRIATQPERPAATITPYGHAKLTLLVLVWRWKARAGWFAALQRQIDHDVPRQVVASRWLWAIAEAWQSPCVFRQD